MIFLCFSLRRSSNDGRWRARNDKRRTAMTVARGQVRPELVQAAIRQLKSRDLFSLPKALESAANGKRFGGRSVRGFSHENGSGRIWLRL